MDYLLLDSQNKLEPVGSISTNQLCSELNLSYTKLNNFINRNGLYKDRYFLVENYFEEKEGDFQQVLVEETKDFLWYVTADGEVYQQNKTDKTRTYIKPRTIRQKKAVNINNKTYDLSQLVKKCFARNFNRGFSF